MDREFVSGAAASLLSLSRSMERCREILSDPTTSAEDRDKAEMALRAAHDLLGRLRHVLAADNAEEMRRRYEEAGPFKPSRD